MLQWLALLCPGICNRRTHVGRGGASCVPEGCASPPPLGDFLSIEKKWESDRFMGDEGVVDQRLLPNHRLRSPHQVGYERKSPIRPTRPPKESLVYQGVPNLHFPFSPPPTWRLEITPRWISIGSPTPPSYYFCTTWIPDP